MSWSSDVRCLHCDGRLPLYRKITSGQFCCASHRKLYWQEQERLGVERLSQTHDSLRAALLPPEGVLAILGTPVPAPDVAPILTQGVAQIADAPAPVAGVVNAYWAPQPKWPTDHLEMAPPEPLLPVGSIRRALRPAAISGGKDFPAAGPAKIPVEARQYRSTRDVEPVLSAVLPCRNVQHAMEPQGSGLGAIEEDIPRAEKLLALSVFAAHENGSQSTRRDPWQAAPFLPQRALLPMGVMQCGVTLAAAKPVQAGLLRLSIDQVPLVHGTWIDSLRALGTAGESPRYELSTPALRPRLRLAAGSRYSVNTRDAAFHLASTEPENLLPLANAVAIPDRKAMATSAGAGADLVHAEIETPVPGKAGLLPLSCANPTDLMTPATAQSLNLPQPLRTEPVRPISKLEPIDEKPISDFMESTPKLAVKKDQPGLGSSFVAPPMEDGQAQTAWMHVSGFWKHAPRDLKLLVFGIPILLALALHPSLKKIPYAAPPQATGIQRTFQSKVKEQWVTVRQTMVERAAIALDEDFRAGLDDWTSRGGTTEWAFDATGFVRPGPLALYRPSLDLTDYQLQFLGMIDKKALSWVVRAADFDDYYVVKLVVLKPGPVPTVGVTRYAVIHGVAQDRADTIALINAREDMLYRVRMDIHGDIFSLTVQGQMVDSWSEPRLRKGGVGFYTARGEASRLRWVQVTHQYDMLGRLCAYLAPYNIPSANGSWQP